jgi:hypothetical protein
VVADVHHGIALLDLAGLGGEFVQAQLVGGGAAFLNEGAVRGQVVAAQPTGLPVVRRVDEDIVRAVDFQPAGPGEEGVVIEMGGTGVAIQVVIGASVPPWLKPLVLISAFQFLSRRSFSPALRDGFSFSPNIRVIPVIRGPALRDPPSFPPSLPSLTSVKSLFVFAQSPKPSFSIRGNESVF